MANNAFEPIANGAWILGPTNLSRGIKYHQSDGKRSIRSNSQAEAASDRGKEHYYAAET
jgi:hypothetical protein